MDFAVRLLGTVLAITYVGLAAPCAAEEAPSDADIERLFAAMDAQTMMRESMGAMRASLQAQLPTILAEALQASRSELTPEQSEAIARDFESDADKLDRLFTFYLAEIDFDELLAVQADAYRKYYTSEEIRALTRFYETSVGKKTLSVAPQLGSDVSLATMKQVLPAMQRAKQKLADAVISEHRAGASDPAAKAR